MIRAFRRYMGQPVTSTFFGWSMVLFSVVMALLLFQPHYT